MQMKPFKIIISNGKIYFPHNLGGRPGFSNSSSMNTLLGTRDDHRQMINSNLFITGIQTLAEYFNARKHMMDDTAATSMLDAK